ncbi:MAG TPA: DUF6101 family protein [Methylocella sp.]|nr:DUF6101 family protein [Methylocella sp.]
MRPPLFASGLPDEIQARSAHDPRADGGHRVILVASRCITIKRDLQGVKMHLRVPVESYTGVVLVEQEHPAGAFFSIRLAHRDPELSVILRAARNRRAGIDAWRQWAAYFAVPALIERGGSLWKIVDPAPGTAPRPAVRKLCAGALPKQRRHHAFRRRRGTIRQGRIFYGGRVPTSYQ